MKNLVFEFSGVNSELLDEELNAVLYPMIVGHSFSNGSLTVHVDDAASELDLEKIADIVLAHDEKDMTVRQEAESLRDARLTAGRVNYVGSELADVADLNEIILRLRWLQDEIENLLG